MENKIKTNNSTNEKSSLFWRAIKQMSITQSPQQFLHYCILLGA